MRVLFTTWAWRSHLYALAPLAWAFRAASHDVLVASQPGLVDEIAQTGLPAAGVGRDVDAAGMVRGYLLPTTPAVTGGPAGTEKSPVPRAMRMLLAHTESMLDGLIELAKRWRPDIVVYETTTLAGPIAAAAIGVPAVRHLYGPDLLLRARRLLPEVLAPLAGQHGVSEFEPLGGVTVDPTPDSLQLPGDHPRIPMRYVPFNGPETLPDRLPATGGRPRICVTWGHTIAGVAPARFLLPSVAEALSELDVDVLVAVSAAQVPLLGPLPPKVRVVVDSPLNQLLPGCDLVVAHGGAGTTLTALHHGVPLLLVPQLPDHTGHANRVSACGAGEVLTAQQASPSRLREEAERCLGDSPRRAAAIRIQQEMRDSPPPAALVPELVAGARAIN
ncbi:nucleotide disphospho-sugar-binding domain-containing protein [Amycolatopsis japonica]|uniref:nucleotide disphospho-sugar-binding domain-containing protein n=1 Tax=Amycolatopsis japonica TaxID=208439 RepID=UPI00332CD0B9